MRIACIHFPGFTLQVATQHVANERESADLSNETSSQAWKESATTEVPLAATLDGRFLSAVSRAASKCGVRTGMPTMFARELCPDITVLPVSHAKFREALHKIGEVLGTLGNVDLNFVRHQEGVATESHAVFMEVPSRMRGDTFGNAIFDVLASLPATSGLVARVGVADDAFTAAVAALTSREAITTVPRGGAGAFLAPKSLSLLGLDRAVETMLAAGGVTTLGEFAALPPPTTAGVLSRSFGNGEGVQASSPLAGAFVGFGQDEGVIRGLGCQGPWSRIGVDLQALARGEGPDRIGDTRRGANDEGVGGLHVRMQHADAPVAKHSRLVTRNDAAAYKRSRRGKSRVRGQYSLFQDSDVVKTA